jgi:hypothetical protein
MCRLCLSLPLPVPLLIGLLLSGFPAIAVCMLSAHRFRLGQSFECTSVSSNFRVFPRFLSVLVRECSLHLQLSAPFLLAVVQHLFAHVGAVLAVGVALAIGLVILVTLLHTNLMQDEKLKRVFHAGATQPDGGPTGLMGHVSKWLAAIRDYSPFAFASLDLEQQYQAYQNSHVGGHVGTMCWSLGVWAGVINLLAWHKSIPYARLWLLSFPMVFCLGFGFFSHYSPAAFRSHWQICSFIVTCLLLLLDNDLNSFTLTHHITSGKLHAGTLLELEFYRMLAFIFYAFGFPLSLPAWAAAQVPLFIQNFTSPSKYNNFQDLVCPSIPWPVSTFLEGVLPSFVGYGANLPKVARCQMGLVFWKVQTEMLAAIYVVLRDVSWRRSFLKAHPHLIGPNGAARAAAWPFGSPRTAVTCVALVVGFIYVDIIAIDIWVSRLAHSG